MTAKHQAVALRYIPRFPAPMVIAKGKGHLAEKLVQLAREFGVEVVESVELAEGLFVIDRGDFIPEPFYRVVAELLAFVWGTQRGTVSHDDDDGKRVKA